MSPNEVTSSSDNPALEGVKRAAHELNHLKDSWWWLFVLGCLLVVCGIVAISFPFLSTIGVVIVIGTVLLISGISLIISSFWTGQWSAFLLQILVGILYIVLGLAITDSPDITAKALTFLFATLFIVVGAFRAMAALVIRFPQWGWALLNGVVTAVLGLVIFRHFPSAGLWLIGTLAGIDILINGVNWIMLSIEVRSLPDIEITETTESTSSEA